MKYFSTRDKKLELNFKSVFVRGLSSDGGLFVPKNIKKYDDEGLKKLSNLNYFSLATEIIHYFCEADFSKEKISEIVKNSYNKFLNKDVVSIKKFEDIALLELYHGPTLAFKDIAMQVIGNIYNDLEIRVKIINYLANYSCPINRIYP